ncbi:MAG TPA: rhodanese-like domain-containing protein [Anaerolineales bacterium]|nr:rhodanese-like domain-containing protein [Anaerolineales bacterium]
MSRKVFIFFLALPLLFASACAAPTTQPASAPTLAPTLTPFPASEAEVPRVAVQEAKAAFDNGTAVIVDVRSAGAFETSHIAGALNIQLADIETNPTNLNLAKDQWIITYCT